MKVLTDVTTSILSRLHLRAEAGRRVSIIPLGSIYWEDEMPEFLDLAKLSEDEQNSIWRLFSIRFSLWDEAQLSAEDREFWEAARADAPNWALFHRLALSSDDREARKEAEANVEKELEALFGDADSVQLTDKGHGLQEFSATFDLGNKPNPEP